MLEPPATQLVYCGVVELLSLMTPPPLCHRHTPPAESHRPPIHALAPSRWSSPPRISIVSAFDSTLASWPLRRRAQWSSAWSHDAKPTSTTLKPWCGGEGGGGEGGGGEGGDEGSGGEGSGEGGTGGGGKAGGGAGHVL